MSYVFNSKDHLSQMTSVHLYEQMIHSLCCQWALSHRPLTIHVRRQRDVATWGQNAESSPWHPPHSQPLTHYKEDVSLDRDFPAVWRPCGTKSCLALLTRALRGTMRGQTGRPPLENNTSWMGILANHHICLTWMVIFYQTNNNYPIIISDSTTLAFRADIYS